MGYGINNMRKILDLLKESGEVMSLKQISEMLDMRQANAWENIDRLCKKGYVKKVRRGKYIINVGLGVPDIDDEIQFANTVRYPVELWPVRRFMGGLLRGVRRQDPETNLDVSFLLKRWEQQEGRCDLSGIPMTTIRGSGYRLPTNVSLDRIDRSKGFIKGNIRLVCWQAKQMRGTLDDEELVMFCRLILKDTKEGTVKNSEANKKEGGE